jgi:phosphoribosyl 1,2-cyclic phosphodiesterase
MKLQFWGVRGYVPTPGAEYIRYGGNTCCTAIYGAGGELVVLDTGTGFCQLGDTLMNGPLGRGQGQVVLLISHPHWDHILGLPFPGVVHLPGNQLTIYGPDSTRGPLEMVYDGLLSPVYSPVYGLAHMGATHHFRTVTGAPFDVGGLTICAWPFVHSTTQASIWAYRIEEGPQSLVYITDVCYLSEALLQQAVDFAHNADILIHSAPYTRDESVRDYGHSRMEDAIDIAEQAGVQRLFLFHHAPERTDDDLDALLVHFRTRLRERGSRLHLEIATEGSLIEV